MRWGTTLLSALRGRTEAGRDAALRNPELQFAFAVGLLRFAPAGVGRWDAQLRAGTLPSESDSLARLDALLKEKLPLRRLHVECFVDREGEQRLQPDQRSARQLQLLEAHRALGRSAPCQVIVHDTVSAPRSPLSVQLGDAPPIYLDTRSARFVGGDVGSGERLWLLPRYGYAGVRLLSLGGRTAIAVKRPAGGGNCTVSFRGFEALSGHLWLSLCPGDEVELTTENGTHRVRILEPRRSHVPLSQLDDRVIEAGDFDETLPKTTRKGFVWRRPTLPFLEPLTPGRSEQPPRLPQAPWLRQFPHLADRTAHLHLDPLDLSRITLHVQSWTRRRNPRTLLAPISPAVAPNFQVTEEPFLAHTVVGVVSQLGGRWLLDQKGAMDLRVNGVRLTTPTHLAAGDVIEYNDGAWIVEFEGNDSPDTGLGPLWTSHSRDTFTFDEMPDGRWRGLLRGGSLTGGLDSDSLHLLRCVVASSVAARLSSLDLHLWSSSRIANWAAFVRAHLEIAQRAPFEVRLFAPYPVEGAQLLEPVLSAEPGVTAFGSGTCWNAQPGDEFRGVPVSERSWVTLAPGDTVRQVRKAGRRDPKPIAADSPLAVQHGSQAKNCPPTQPRALFPSERWRCAAFEPTPEGWVVENAGLVTRWQVAADGIREVLANESLGEVCAWFQPVVLEQRDAFIPLPRRSRFLNGERGCEPNAQRMSVLVDMLLEEDDAAAEGLSVILQEGPDAEAWLRQLLSPYGKADLWGAGIALDACQRTGFYFTSMRFKPWRDFQRDVPVLMGHPMLAHLRRLEIVTTDETLFERINGAVAESQRDLEVVVATQ